MPPVIPSTMRFCWACSIMLCILQESGAIMAITSWLCDKRSCANKYWQLLIVSPLIACGWLVPSIPAQAASFDCAKAATKVEILICADAELSKLDDELKT